MTRSRTLHQQAALWFSLIVSSSGSSVRQTFMAASQRGQKAQPFGRFSMLMGVPLMGTSRSFMLIGGDARKSLVGEYVKGAEALLAPYVARFRELVGEPAVLIREGRPGDVIVDEAGNGDYDLVIMGSRGLSDLGGMLVGSSAHRVLSAARCPVLIAR